MNAKLKAIFSGKVRGVLPAFDRTSNQTVVLMANQNTDMEAALAKLKACNAPNSLCVLRFEMYMGETHSARRRLFNKLAVKRSEIVAEIGARNAKPDDPAELLYKTCALETFLWIFSAFSLVVLNSWVENQWRNY